MVRLVGRIGAAAASLGQWDLLGASRVGRNQGRQEAHSREVREALHRSVRLLDTSNGWNNKGVSHENGSVESSHGHLKNRIRQELLLRGSNNFDTLAEYEQWIYLIVQNSNKRNSKKFKIEQQYLQKIPANKCVDFEIKSVKVSSHSAPSS